MYVGVCVCNRSASRVNRHEKNIHSAIVRLNFLHRTRIVTHMYTKGHPEGKMMMNGHLTEQKLILHSLKAFFHFTKGHSRHGAPKRKKKTYTHKSTCMCVIFS